MHEGSDGIWQYVNIDNGLQPGDFTQIISMGMRNTGEGKINTKEGTFLWW